MDYRDPDGLESRFNKLLDKIPVLGDFRGRERLREQDKALRTHTSAGITRIKGNIDNLKQILLSQGKLGMLDDLDALNRKLDRARDTHRFDAYGLSGMLDPNAIKEDALEKLYEYDLKIVEEVAEKEEMTKNLADYLTEEALKEAMPTLRQAVDELLDLILKRKEALNEIA